MARAKSFDRDAVLSKAMAVFWEKGYEATSMQDLVTAMGIHRGSLYDTFTDKAHLFQAAITHYTETVISPAIAPLQQPGAARAAIEQYFLTFVERAATESPSRGCLLTNAVVELAAHQPTVAGILKKSLQQVEDALYRALGRAQDTGEISPDQDIRALAHYLTTSLQGLRVMAKLDTDLETLKQSAQLILWALDR